MQQPALNFNELQDFQARLLAGITDRGQSPKQKAGLRNEVWALISAHQAPFVEARNRIDLALRSPSLYTGTDTLSKLQSSINASQKAAQVPSLEQTLHTLSFEDQNGRKEVQEAYDELNDMLEACLASLVRETESAEAKTAAPPEEADRLVCRAWRAGVVGIDPDRVWEGLSVLQESGHDCYADAATRLLRQRPSNEDVRFGSILDVEWGAASKRVAERADAAMQGMTSRGEKAMALIMSWRLGTS